MATPAIPPSSGSAESQRQAIKPQGILKRKRSDNSPSSSPKHIKSYSKRQRVAFDPEIESKHSDETGSKDATLIRLDITHAITSNNVDARETLAEIVSHFSTPLDSDDAPSSALLCNYLSGLTGNATLLNQVPEVVSAVIHHPWLGRDKSFVTNHTRFLGHLVSSNGGYLSSVLKMLVENLAHVSTSLGRSASYLIPERDVLFSRVHTAIKYILGVVPSASLTLSSMVEKSFPPSHDAKRAHKQYVQNIFRIIEYAPELKANLLDLVTERLIKIDVEVQVDVEDLDVDEEVADLLPEARSQLGSKTLEFQDDEPYSDAESDMSDDEFSDAKERSLKELKSKVEKMDNLLDQLFTYHDDIFTKRGDNGSDFKQLLSQFRKIILPTYRSRHTQFLIFHFAQTSSELTVAFTNECLKILTDRRHSSILRGSAAAYLASFVARGARVSSETVLHVVDRLSEYLDRLRRECEPNCRNPDLRKFHVYYATVQALIYIFCFRWRDFLARPDGYDSDASDDEDEDDLLASGRELNWTLGVKETFSANFFSPLNPLKVCSPEIVEEFARISRYARFVYVYQILNSNKRIRLHQSVVSASAREAALTQTTGERHLQLDAYFPFDPYLLPCSKRWMNGDYIDYKPVVQEPQVVAGKAEYEELASSDNEDSDMDDDSENEEVDVEDQRTATPVESDDS